MPRTRRSSLLLPALTLGLHMLAQAPASNPKAAVQPGPGAAASPATPLTADQGISPEELIAVRATPYRPTLVRDPFAAPTDAEQSHKGDLVDDIAVKGRVLSRGKAMAIVSDARGNIRTLGIGFKFRDGELVAVDDKSATFHQWDVSGSNTRVYRTVVKTFKREEGKR